MVNSPSRGPREASPLKSCGISSVLAGVSAAPPTFTSSCWTVTPVFFLPDACRTVRLLPASSCWSVGVEMIQAWKV